MASMVEKKKMEANDLPMVSFVIPTRNSERTWVILNGSLLPKFESIYYE
jgi:hypothetical protein